MGTSTNHPDHLAQRRHWPDLVNQSAHNPDLHTVQLQLATTYQQRECRSLHPSTESTTDKPDISNRRYLNPTFTTEKLEYHRRPFPHLYNQQSTAEQDPYKAVLKQNRTVYQTSSNELQFQDELGGTLHRLTEHELKSRYLGVNSIAELDLIPTLTIEQVQGLRQVRQLQSYQQQIKGNRVKPNSVKHQPYDQRCTQQQLQQDVVGVQQLPTIDTPDERIVPRPITPLDAGKGKKNRRMTNKKPMSNAGTNAAATKT